MSIDKKPLDDDIQQRMDRLKPILTLALRLVIMGVGFLIFGWYFGVF